MPHTSQSTGFRSGLRNCAVDFVEIGNVYVGKVIIKAAKRIFNSDMIRYVVVIVI